MKKHLFILTILLALLPVIGHSQTRPSILQIKPISTLAGLRAIIPSTNGTWAYVSGHTTDGDGGGGDFVWNSSSTLADDNGHVIIPTGHTGDGRWLRISDLKCAKHYGIFPGGSVCQAAAVNAVLNSMQLGETLNFDQGLYWFEAPIIIPKAITISGVGRNTGYPPTVIYGTEFKFTSSSGIKVKAALASIEHIGIYGYPEAIASDVNPIIGDFGDRMGIDMRCKNDPDGYTPSATHITDVSIRGFDVGLLFGHETPDVATAPYEWGGAYYILNNIVLTRNAIGLAANHYVTDIRGVDVRFDGNYAHSIFANSAKPYQNITLTNSILEAAWTDLTHVAPASTSIYIGENTKANFIGCYFEAISLFNTTNSFVRFVGGHFQRSTTAMYGLGEVAGLSTVFGDEYLLPIDEKKLAWENLASSSVWLPDIGTATYITNTVATASNFRINSDLGASDTWNIPQMTYVDVLSSSTWGYREVPFLFRCAMRVESSPSDLSSNFLRAFGIKTWSIDGKGDSGDDSGYEYSRLAMPIDNAWHTMWILKFARRSEIHSTPEKPIVNASIYIRFGGNFDNFGVGKLKVYMLTPEVRLFRNRGSF